MLLIKYHESLISEEYCFLENKLRILLWNSRFRQGLKLCLPESVFSYQTVVASNNGDTMVSKHFSQDGMTRFSDNEHKSRRRWKNLQPRIKL